MRLTQYNDRTGHSHTIEVDSHLFAGLPLRVVHTNANEDEKESLLKGHIDAEPSRTTRIMQRVPVFALAVGSTACACLAVLLVIIVALGYRRVNAALESVDGAVSIHDSATSAIRNVNSILNSSAQIANVVHTLGLKGIDASVFSKPFLTHLLNTTDKIFDDTHNLLERPQIKFG
jgi:hypothetical protein